jgi:hypothetical protein
VSEPTASALYTTRQHYRKTVPDGKDNNMFNKQHLILEIKEKLGKFVGVYIAKPCHIDSKQ